MKICPTCKAEYAGGEVFCPVDASRLTTPSQMAPFRPDEDPLVGSTLAERYRIIRQIGEGGMGIVYEAEHVVIEKRVALKVLRDDFSRKPEVVERFRQEAKSASRIGHEHIVDISDFGETPWGQSFFVMEYLEGEDLANVLAREATLAPDRAVEIVVQCCRALGAAHAKGIVHRDMKPENVFLVKREDGQDFVKIVDFGIAKMSDIETPGSPSRKLTKTGMIFGTPEYMSPEQAAGKHLDHRVDIYAMGVILYEMITGRVPFMGDSFMGVLTQHMFEPVPSLMEANPGVRVNPGLEAAIMKALSKEADDRFQTMEEMAQALHMAMDWSHGPGTNPGFGDPTATSPGRVRAAAALPTVSQARTASGRQRRSSRVAVFAAAGAAVVLGAVVVGWLALRSDADAEQAEGEGTQPASEPMAMVDRGDGEEAEATPGASAGAPARDDPAEATDDEAAEPQGEPEDQEAEPSASEDAPEAAAPDAVEVRVRTRPTGAEVSVEGRGVVCEASPCSFETPPDERIRIRARRGRAIARKAIAPSEDTTVRMRLSAPRRTPRARGARTDRDQGAGGDLKVPDIFR
ncbi:MAG: serine/threonine-protein kinase [Myxococcota bacterium]